MEAMAAYFRGFFSNFIDIVYKILIVFTINLIIYHRKSQKLEMRSNLVQSTSFGRCFDEADGTVVRVVTGSDHFEFCDCGVGPGYDGLADIDPTRLVFSETVEGLVDEAGFWRLAMDEGEVGLMNFTALLHFSEEGGVIFPPGDK